MEERKNQNVVNAGLAAFREGEEGAARGRRRQQRIRHRSGRSTSPVFETVETAAAKLNLDADALRARCRRASEQVGDAVVAQLGGGIVAFKFGKSWRIRFPAA